MIKFRISEFPGMRPGSHTIDEIVLVNYRGNVKQVIKGEHTTPLPGRTTATAGNENSASSGVVHIFLWNDVRPNDLLMMI